MIRTSDGRWEITVEPAEQGYVARCRVGMCGGEIHAPTLRALDSAMTDHEQKSHTKLKLER